VAVAHVCLAAANATNATGSNDRSHRIHGELTRVVFTMCVHVLLQCYRCAWDGVVNGPFYLWALYAYRVRSNSIRLPAIVCSSMLLYSTCIYFAYEVGTCVGRKRPS
jgi:hypothetical protein